MNLNDVLNYDLLIDTDMKTLIVYYSFTGNNEALMLKLQERLNCDAIRIQTVRKRNGSSILWDIIFKRSPKLQAYNIPFSDYEHLVLVAPVWAGKIATPMQTFLKTEKKNILSYSFITLCGGAAGQKKKIDEYLKSTLLSKPRAVEELWVNDLLRPEQKDTIKFTTAHRVKEDDWHVFNAKLDDFVAMVADSPTEKVHVR